MKLVDGLIFSRGCLNFYLSLKLILQFFYFFTDKLNMEFSSKPLDLSPLNICNILNNLKFLINIILRFPFSSFFNLPLRLHEVIYLSIIKYNFKGEFKILFIHIYTKKIQGKRKEILILSLPIHYKQNDELIIFL